MNSLDEIDELTLRMVAITDRVSYAAACRAALSERAAELREEQPWIAEAVEAMLAARHKTQSNVIPLRKTR